ncbi:MAG TPA: hypothetical protein VGL03_05405 [Thermoanaerobaculia bacterium]
MRRSNLRAFAEREWQVLAERKSTHWKEVKRMSGAAWGIRVGEELRRHARRLHPKWPARKDRRDDLTTHARVASSLRRVPPRRTR